MLNRFFSMFGKKAFDPRFATILSTSNAFERPFKVRALINGYNEFKWLRAVVMKIADMGSAVKWVTVDENGEVIDNHPLTQLIEAGNMQFGGRINLKLAFIYLCLVNTSDFLKQRSNGTKIDGLLPIPPQWVDERPVLGIGIYRITPDNGNVQTFQPEDIISIIDPDPVNPYRAGRGVGEALGDDLETDKFATKHTKNFFHNNARPDLLIQSEDAENPFGKDGVTRLEQGWTQKLQGFKNSFLPFFLPGRVKIDKIGSEYKDLGMNELRKMSRDTILQVYGLSPEVLGVVENSNRATIQAAERFVFKHVIVPKLEVIKDAFNNNLAPEFGNVKLDFVSPIKEDKEQRIQVIQNNGFAFTANEIRDAAGLPKLPVGGDIHAIPFNLFLADQLTGTMPMTEERSIDGVLEKSHTKQDGAEEGSNTVRNVTTAIATASAAEAAKGPVGDTMVFFGNQVFEQAGVEIVFDLADERAIQFISEFGFDSVQNTIDATTNRNVRSTLVEGLRAGEGTAKLADRIQDVFDVRMGQAGTIARTETIRAASFSTQIAMEAAQVPSKRWIATFNNTRDTHIGLHNKIVPVNQQFQSASGATAPGPGQFGVASEDINCQCFIQPVINETRALQDSEEKLLAIWKSFESDRQQFERALRAIFIRGFIRQREAALLALRGLESQAA